MPEDFFTEESRRARSALRQAVKEAGQSLQEKSDISPLVRQRPFISLAAAATGGAIAGFLMIPKRRTPEEKAKRRQDKQEKKRQEGQKEQKLHKQEHQGILGLLQVQLMHALTPALRSFASSAAGSVFHHAQEPPGHDGPHEGEFSDLPHHRVQI